MGIHRDVANVVNNVVLRDVIQVHGMDIPYPAELSPIHRRDECRGGLKVQESAPVFGDNGFLNTKPSQKQEHSIDATTGASRPHPNVL